MGVKRPRCFFDVTISGQRVGRIVIELFSDVTPKTCENFRCLCTGEKGIGKTTGKPLHYVGTNFHRVVKDFMVQCGDFLDGNGKGGESIFGGQFEDDNFDLKHDRPFLLSMANKGPNTNGSQFFITTQPAIHLDGIHTVFGHILQGKEIISEIEQLQVDKKNRPLVDARIFNSGELIPKSKAKKAESSSSSSESSEAEQSEQEEKEEKKKKKGAKKEKKKKKKKNKE
jgi:peptidyl-prolyl isomerase G (cyclophilin G)